MFPFAAAFFVAAGISLNFGGILLMALGAQWYILFNVIAGASAIPSDLREAMRLMGVRGRVRWTKFILPAIFPAYVTGGITAAGGAWNAAGLREAFVERIFATARLRSLLDGSWSPGDLVAFHARHKLQMLAHDPARYRSAGQVVAAAGTAPREQTVALYRDAFLAAMASPTSRSRHANALQHAYSRIGQELDRPRRTDLVARIEAYRRGEESLSVPVALLAHYASGGGFGWLAEQTYLKPFPPDLRLRHSVSAGAG